MSAIQESLAPRALRAIQSEERHSEGLWRDALRRLFYNRLAFFGALVVLLVIFMAVFGPSLVRYDPDGMDFSALFSGPTSTHWMGTDEFGRDIFTRIVIGARISLMVGIVAVSISTIAGTLLGMIAGFSHRTIDEVIMRAMDVLYAFPFLLLAIAIVAVLGRGFLNVMIALGVVYTPDLSRASPGRPCSGVRNEEFIQAARALGAGEAAHHLHPRHAQYPLAHHRGDHPQPRLRHPRRSGLEFLLRSVCSRPPPAGGGCWRKGATTCTNPAGCRSSPAWPSC